MGPPAGAVEYAGGQRDAGAGRDQDADTDAQPDALRVADAATDPAAGDPQPGTVTVDATRDRFALADPVQRPDHDADATADHVYPVADLGGAQPVSLGQQLSDSPRPGSPATP